VLLEDKRKQKLERVKNESEEKTNIKLEERRDHNLQNNKLLDKTQ